MSSYELAVITPFSGCGNWDLQSQASQVMESSLDARLVWAQAYTNGTEGPQAMQVAQSYISHLLLPQGVASSTWRCRQELAMSFKTSQLLTTVTRDWGFTRILAAASETHLLLSCLYFLSGKIATWKKTLYQVYLKAFLSSWKLLNPSHSLKVLMKPVLCKSITRFPFKQEGPAPQTDIAKAYIMQRPHPACSLLNLKCLALCLGTQ